MKKTIKIEADKVRSICIRQEWYTKGDCDQYDNLLTNLCKNIENATDADILAVINDIYDHSDVNGIAAIYGADLKEVKNNIAYYIYNDCLTTLIEL